MKENLRLRKELEKAKKGKSLLKKAAIFFAKEIDERLIDFSNNTIMYLDCVGSYDIFIFTPMLITTTENKGINCSNKVLFLKTVGIKI